MTIKSPRNGRGLMNYGLSQMSKGKYEVALDYYLRALELTPRYSYLHVTLGILKEAMGRPDEAEAFFRSALRFDRSNPEAYYYFAR